MNPKWLSYLKELRYFVLGILALIFFYDVFVSTGSHFLFYVVSTFMLFLFSISFEIKLRVLAYILFGLILGMVTFLVFGQENIAERLAHWTYLMLFVCILAYLKDSD
ncbi:hypothetical protein KAZ57_00795 [Patescibacteria group bacterium]|nr:hypothetical protein [Patescibacteria group bacterium]